MKLIDILNALETNAPGKTQESYDNSGLIIGDREREIHSALITLDITEEVLQEAIDSDCDLLISHHPMLFKPIQRISNATVDGRIIQMSIKNNIAIYAIHTNLDNSLNGVNAILAEKLGLQKCRILSPMKNMLKKIISFCPTEHIEAVRDAIFEAGAGHIGNYDACSFNVEGYGTFRAGEGADPFVGRIGKIHKEKEIRFEAVYPAFAENNIINALKKAHPYEEVAYDLYTLDNSIPNIGAGMIGQLAQEMDTREFLTGIKSSLGIPTIKHTKIVKDTIKTVAFCGGSGAFLIQTARSNKADIYLTGDIKYHDYFEAGNEMVIADIGHYESEQFTKDLIYKKLIEKFPTFAVRISNTRTNPVYYF